MTSLVARAKRGLSNPAVPYALVVIALCVACNAYTYNKIFPLTGGFYSVAAKSMSEGLLPYKDFQLLFPPVYTYLIYGVTQLFGYNFIVLRLFGMGLFALGGLLLFVLLRKLFGDFPSCVGSVVGMFMLQSSNAFAAYDYLRIHDILALAALCLVINVLAGSVKRSRGLLQAACAGALAGALMFVRQSSGIMIAFALLLCLLVAVLAYGDRKTRIEFLGAFCAGMAGASALIVAAMAANGMLPPFLSSVFGDAAAAKGGIITALFGWIDGTVDRLFENLHLVLFGLFVASICAAYRSGPAGEDGGFHAGARRLLTLLLALGIFCGMAYCYWRIEAAKSLSEMYSSDVPYLIFYVLCALLVAHVIRFASAVVSKNDEVAEPAMKLASVEGVFLAISWGGAMSSSLGFQTGYPTIALLCAGALFCVERSRSILPQVACVLGALFLCLTFFCAKMLAPYSWWGMNSGSADQMLYEVDAPYMEGIYVTRQTKESVEQVYGVLEDTLAEDDQLFCFPQNPMFYLMLDKRPFTYSYTQWFDVSSDEALREDMELIRERQPKAILIEYLPDSTFAGHESAFRDGNISQQRIMQDELYDYVHAQGYSVAVERDEGNGYTLALYVRDYEDAETVSSSSSTSAFAYGGGQDSLRKWNAWLVAPLAFALAVLLGAGALMLRLRNSGTTS